MDNLDQLFNISQMQRLMMPSSLLLPGTVEPHAHCRPEQTGQMAMAVAECAREHEAIIDIPNVPGIKTIDDLKNRRNSILFLSGRQDFQAFLTPLVNDHSEVNVFNTAYRQKIICGVKIFWQGVSNDYGNSISCVAAIKDFLRELDDNIPITHHAECRHDYRGIPIPIKDREFWCIEHEVESLLVIKPRGIFVIRHVSDLRTLQWINLKRKQGYNIHAEICPQYMILIDDDLFTSDEGHAVLQCNCIHWPRPKDARSRKAIQRAALSGKEYFHIGLDYAMHLWDPSAESGVKLNDKGQAVGGLNFLPRVAKSILIDFYVSNGKQALLAPMLSRNAAKLYGIKLSGREYQYIRKDWVVGEFTYGTQGGGQKPPGRQIRARNFLAGHTMHWQLAA